MASPVKQSEVDWSLLSGQLASLSIRELPQNADTWDAEALFRCAQEATDPAIRIRYLQLAADKGFFKAQIAIGMCFLKGDGVVQDLNQAEFYFQNAAQQSSEDADVQLCLGRLYLAKNNRDLALDCLKRAADLGDPFHKHESSVIIIEH